MGVTTLAFVLFAGLSAFAQATDKAAYAGRKLSQTETLENLVNTLPKTTAADNPPQNYLPVGIFPKPAVDSLLATALTPTPAPGPGPASLLPTLGNDRRRLSESLADLIASTPTTVASNNPPTEKPVVNVFATDIESSATAPAPTTALQGSSTPAPAPGPDSLLPTLGSGGRRLSESLADLIASTPTTVASNNPPTEVPVVNVFAADAESAATAPAPTPVLEGVSIMAPALAPGPSPSASDLPTLGGSSRRLLIA